jgi:hypothetical protein
MKNLITKSLYLFTFTFLLISCGGQSSTEGNSLEENTTIEESVSSRNLTYMCPLCTGETEFSCPDCTGELIWCEFDGDVHSIHCPTCEWVGYIMTEGCAHCGKELRNRTKFWTNKSGQNYSDCQY